MYTYFGGIMHMYIHVHDIMHVYVPVHIFECNTAHVRVSASLSMST